MQGARWVFVVFVVVKLTCCLLFVCFYLCFFVVFGGVSVVFCVVVVVAVFLFLLLYFIILYLIYLFYLFLCLFLFIYLFIIFFLILFLMVHLSRFIGISHPDMSLDPRTWVKEMKKIRKDYNFKNQRKVVHVKSALYGKH